MKNKGVIEVTYELIREALMLPISTNVEDISANKNNETVRVKLSSTNEETMHEVGLKVCGETEEGENLLTVNITEEMFRFLLAKRLTDMSSSMNNSEFLSSVLMIADSRPNLRETLAELLKEPPETRKHYI